METKYGSFSSGQIQSTKQNIRRSIFFLLLYVDPETRVNYPNIDVADAFHSLQYKLNGLNSILLEPPELVETMSLLETALQEYSSDNFDFRRYRKLVLDAGAKIMQVKVEDTKVKEGD